MTPVKQVAVDHHLAVYQPEKLSRSEELEKIMALSADGIVTAAFGQFCRVDYWIRSVCCQCACIVVA